MRGEAKSLGRREGIAISSLVFALALIYAFSAHALAAGGPKAPPADVSPMKLASKYHCERQTQNGELKDEAALKAAKETPIVFVTGTGASGDYAYLVGEPAFDLEGRTVCWTNFPDAPSTPQTWNTTGDVQISAQYLVHAIRKTFEGSKRKVAVFGISQGGLLARFALTYWSDLRSKVSDVISAAGTHHGTTAISAACTPELPCPPAAWQQKKGSNLLRALNSQPDETPGTKVGWTTLRSLDDETVLPVTENAITSTSALSGATNILIQDICPDHTTSHIGTAIDSVTFAALVDALNHAGAAVPDRFPGSGSVCDPNQLFAPGISNAQGANLLATANGLTSAGQTNAGRVNREPAVRRWFLIKHR